VSSTAAADLGLALAVAIGAIAILIAPVKGFFCTVTALLAYSPAPMLAGQEENPWLPY
jgi:hypothetical protein